MSTYRVRYLDSKTGESVQEWEGEAEDSGDAIDQAHDADYYVGKILDVDEIS